MEKTHAQDIKLIVQLDRNYVKIFFASQQRIEINKQK